jgi:RNA polymerase sigma factor (sigma-70 family)
MRMPAQAPRCRAPGTGIERARPTLMPIKMRALPRSHDSEGGPAPERVSHLRCFIASGESLRSEHECSDGELVSRSRLRDAAAYGELVRRHERSIHRHLLNLTGSREEARELAQEVFLKAWQALPATESLDHVKAWLYRIASNLAFDLLRRRKVVSFEAIGDDDDAASADNGPEQRLQTKQAMARLDAALAALPAELKEVILLREIEGLHYDEISTALAINIGTVKSRLARARAVLAERYQRANP